MKNISILTLTLALAASATGFAQFSGQRVNLGSGINSEGNTDSAPVITYDGNTMFFKRSVAGASYDYDVYTSTMGSDKKWSKAVPVAELNNDKISEVEYVYPDGKTMIVCGTFEGKSGIFYAFLKNGKWQDFQQLDLGKELDANEDNLNVTLNTKLDVMIISIHGDLFLSRNKNGKWSEAEEIKSLNTSGYEYTPFLDYDDNTLYIAGTGYGGNSGEADIWVCKRTDDTYMNWSAPEKVKGNINTEGWDSFFYVSPTKDYVYVYSLTEGGGDILTIETEIKPENPVAVNAIIDTPVLTPEDNQLISQATATDLQTEVDGRQQTDDVNRSAGSNMNEVESILVYPNPTKGQFNLTLHNSNENTFSRVVVYDVNLKPVTSIGTSQSTYNFDLSEFANGIYFVHVECNGKKEVKKVILEK
jgi:hypothetical protein